MNRDFSVDAEGMSQLIEKVSAAEKMVWEHDVDDFMPSGEVGHAGVAEGIREFSARWELGINTMVADLGEVGGRLSGVLQAYGEYNQASEEAMSQLRAVMESLHAVPGMSPGMNEGLG